MPKSPDAFRTISEVADWLGIQAHVLRFWESKFTQVKPIKRAGGRRYYRPADMLLLGGIKRLLHDDGLTIKGVQKLLREEGMSHVAALSEPLDDMTLSDMGDTPPKAAAPEAAPQPEVEEDTGVVLPFEAAKPETLDHYDVKDTPEHAENPDVSDQPLQAGEDADAAPEAPQDHARLAPERIEISLSADPPAPPPDEASQPEQTAEAPAGETADAAPQAGQDQAAPEAEDTPAHEPVNAAQQDAEAMPAEEASAATAPADGHEGASDDAAELPAFLRKPMTETEVSPTDNVPAETGSPTPQDDAADEEAPEPAPPPAPKPRIIEMPSITPEAELDAVPAALSAATRARKLNAEQAEKVRPLLAQLAALRDSMASSRKRGPSAPGKD